MTSASSRPVVPPRAPAPPTRPARARDPGLPFSYGPVHALKGVTLEVPERSVTALIGPSGCGKSTLLRSFNRMNDLIPGVSHRGRGPVRLGSTFSTSGTDVVELRRRVGMVFQRPNPFPKSIFDNVAFGLRMLGLKNRGELEARVETVPAPRGAVGRGEGPPRPLGAPALGRPAAAAVHRALPGGRARGDADGRAGLGARPDRDRPDRGADPRAQVAPTRS